MITPASVWADISLIRRRAPLVHNITNYVVMNSSANALLALGASPVMAHAAEEVDQMARLASALVLNIGTLSPAWVEAMMRAGRAARLAGVPIVLDPVGAGATPYRTETAGQLLRDINPSIVRGNGSEVATICGGDAATRGVDATISSSDALGPARRLAATSPVVVSISGAIDVIVSGDRVTQVHNGHAIMPRITGLGCASTALTGAFAAVNPSAHRAAAHAMVVMGVAGEVAAEGASGPGSFWPRFLDALYALDEATLVARMRVSEA